MNKKILASIFVIGMLALAMGWGTYSFFSDTEKSTGNVFTAGTIDIAVDGKNPWTKTYSTELSDVKPSENRWITFVITNPGDNPVDVWKRIVVTGCTGGIAAYWTASSEPEWTEGGGKPDGTGYTERCWLPPYILYDLKIPGVRWIVTQEQQIRIDNINGFWIYLGEIPEGGSMTVEQSYHLSSWLDAPILDVTNWAQGDTMKFDIELYAEQVSGVGPAVETLRLEDKDPKTWEVLDTPNKYGEFTYGTGFTFKGYGLVEATQYSLIYYKDKWPGTGSVLLASGTGSEFMIGMSGTLPTPIPGSDDFNYPVGGKIWLVLSSDFDTDHMKAWNPTNYLFEMHLINVP
jgi:predicted ribosomally synthesized peptide with SipW-like signal peptide